MTDKINEDCISEDENGEEGTTSFPQISKEEIGNILGSVKIDVDSDFSLGDDVLEVVEKEVQITTSVPVKKEKATKAGKKEISKVDLEQDLFSEFSSFMEVKANIKCDTEAKIIIPTGIEILDAIMGGGFAAGTMATICGPPGGGKSCLVAQTVGNFQKVLPGNLAAYLDSEEATTTSRLYNLGVRAPKIKPYNDVTVEKVFKFLEGLCLFKEQKKISDKPSILVWDSIANTLSEKERECEDVNSVIGYKARMLSILIPRYIAKLAKYNILLLTVNQLRDVISIGPYSAPRDLKFMSSSKDMPGGTVLKYNAFHLLETKVSGTCTIDKYGFDGYTVKVKCVKNKLFSPNIEVTMVGDFISGFSNFHTNYKFLVDNERLQSGAWNFLRTAPDIKFRTKDAETLYKTDDNFKNAFNDSVKECIKTVIIDPNTYEVED
jgi:RecA/RadA recombinase